MIRVGGASKSELVCADVARAPLCCLRDRAEPGRTDVHINARYFNYVILRSLRGYNEATLNTYVNMLLEHIESTLGARAPRAVSEKRWRGGKL